LVEGWNLYTSKEAGKQPSSHPDKLQDCYLKMRETISFGGQSTSDSSCLRSPDTTCMNSGKTTRVSTHRKLSLTTTLSGLNLPLQVMKLLHKTSLACIDIAQDHFLNASLEICVTERIGTLSRLTDVPSVQTSGVGCKLPQQLSIRYVHVLRLGESPIPIQIRYLATTANPTFSGT